MSGCSHADSADARPDVRKGSILTPIKSFGAVAFLACLIGLVYPVLAEFSIPWSTLDGGGGTSTGGVYSVSGTIGQPDAGEEMAGGDFTLEGGFWVMPIVVQTDGAPTLEIAPAAAGFATLSWSPDTGTNWVLQESLDLTSGVWSNAPSAWTNPATVPASPPVKFYRLFRP